jgi:hypothetical protein
LRGTAGASARREYERRRARREQAVRERHPRVGGLLLALRNAPAHESSWARGADGEAMVAAALEARCRPEVALLHDRRLPGSRANIDHLAVTPSGVWVIDAKRYSGRIRVVEPLSGAPRLDIGGRDRSSLVEGLHRQVEVVKTVLAPGGPVPVHGVLCFVQGELPLLRTPVIGGFPLLGRRALAKRLNADGPLGVGEIEAVTTALAHALSPA